MCIVWFIFVWIQALLCGKLVIIDIATFSCIHIHPNVCGTHTFPWLCRLYPWLSWYRWYWSWTNLIMPTLITTTFFESMMGTSVSFCVCVVYHFGRKVLHLAFGSIFQSLNKRIFGRMLSKTCTSNLAIKTVCGQQFAWFVKWNGNVSSFYFFVYFIELENKNKKKWMIREKK